MRDIGKMDRRLLGDDTALLFLRLALVALDDIDAGDQSTISYDSY